MVLQKQILKTIIPYIGTSLVLCGFIKISLFYNHFDIAIHEYLEFSEILISFLPDIIIYGGAFFIILLLKFIFEPVEDSENTDNFMRLYHNTPNFKSRLNIFYKMHAMFIWLCVVYGITFIILGIWLREGLWPFINFTFPSILGLGIMILIFEYGHKFKLMYGKDLSATYHNLILLSVTLTTISITSAWYQIIKSENQNNFSIYFKYDEIPLKSNTNLIYLGQTRNYLFLFDKKNNESQIFERKNIKHYKIIRLEN